MALFSEIPNPLPSPVCFPILQSLFFTARGATLKYKMLLTNFSRNCNNNRSFHVRAVNYNIN